MSDHGSIWGPFRKAGRAIVAIVSHLLVAAVLISGFYLLERWVWYLWGDTNPLLFGSLPLKYMFHAADAGVIAVLAGYAVYDIHRIMRG